LAHSANVAQHYSLPCALDDPRRRGLDLSRLQFGERLPVVVATYPVATQEQRRMVRPGLGIDRRHRPSRQRTIDRVEVRVFQIVAEAVRGEQFAAHPHDDPILFGHRPHRQRAVRRVFAGTMHRAGQHASRKP
jgi:hypothetical protein